MPVNIAGVLAYPNDEGGRMIRFIDSEYNTLFHVPDGGNVILTTFDDARSIRSCRYIADYHTVIGGDTFHRLIFALEKSRQPYCPATRFASLDLPQ